MLLPRPARSLEAAVPEGVRGPRMKGQSTNSRISTEAGNAVYGSKLHPELEEKWMQCVLRPRPHPAAPAGSVAEETPLAE